LESKSTRNSVTTPLSLVAQPGIVRGVVGNGQHPGPDPKIEGAVSSLEYRDLLNRQQAAVRDGYLAASRRLRWPAERLAQERERRLRELLAWSVERSPFHRERLRGVDVANFTEADLPTLPIMTKTDLMGEFNRAVTDPELTLDVVNSHVDAVDDDAYLLGQYRTLATSGSTGVRGIFVYGWDDWISFYLLATRWPSPDHGIEEPTAPELIGTLYASNARHVSGAMHAFSRGLDDGGTEVVHLPATLPVPEIIAGFNAAQPTILQGYPTAIHLLALEAAAGLLRISPRRVLTCGEQCTEEARTAVRDTWGIEIDDEWGCSEGIYAFPCTAGRAMHLPDDLAIIEPCDRDGNVVPPGSPAEKILLTNLYNRTQPLIRYEIADGMTLLDGVCECGCAHRRIDGLSGRTDTFFRYREGIAVHPMAMATALLGGAGVAEYQVSQTPDGADVRVVCDLNTDLEHLRRNMVAMMEQAGLRRPQVTITSVDTIERLWSGKIKQFQPLAKA
jgi:phenylacetate-CoA ligase